MTMTTFNVTKEAFISKGNEKTGIWSVNLLAGNSNHAYSGSIPKNANPELKTVCGTCDCDCPGCYAKAMTRYTACFEHYAENTLFAINDPVGFVESIEKQLFGGMFSPRVFRFHDSGDFFTLDYFSAVCDMVKRHPECQFGAYTKRADIVTAYGLENLPENLSLQCSPWEGFCEPIGDLPQFCYDDGSNPELSSLHHCPAVNKDGKRTGVQCKDCLHCYHARRGERWAVYAH